MDAFNSKSSHQTMACRLARRISSQSRGILRPSWCANPPWGQAQPGRLSTVPSQTRLPSDVTSGQDQPSKAIIIHDPNELQDDVSLSQVDPGCVWLRFEARTVRQRKSSSEWGSRRHGNDAAVPVGKRDGVAELKWQSFLVVLLRCGVKRLDHPLALWCAIGGLHFGWRPLARFQRPLTRDLDLLTYLFLFEFVDGGIATFWLQ